MGYFVAMFALLIALVALIRGQGAARWAALAVGVAALGQVVLGIYTVLMVSPFWPSLLHQLGAAILWMAALVCARAAWR
jgi:heme A synthase